jgi:ABC-2 type transport system ATP-binding protein
MTPAIETTGLTKRYGHRLAVDDLDLEVPQGALAGFIGPNGAGKTTTLRMLVGLVAPTAGAGAVLGAALGEPGRYLDRVGALIEGPAFYAGLSGAHNLRVLAAASDVAAGRIPSLLARVGLSDRAGDPYKTYSLGMKQRLGIAAALLGDPELLILDEPANGLDPEGMHDMRELLRALRDEGRTVVVSSHLLAELEQVCDWLVVIGNGRRLFQGPPVGLTGTDRLTLRPEHPRDLGTLVHLLTARGLASEVAETRVLVPFADADARRGEVAELVRAATAAGITLVEIGAGHTELEQSYLDLVGAAG